MRIVHLTAGTGSFFCGTCIRDNALVRGLRDLEHDAHLLPLYLPVKVEGEDTSEEMPLFFGGINVYLQQVSAMFRALPTWMDRPLDARFLLDAAGKRAGSTRPEDTVDMTLSMLAGPEGFQAKEIKRLLTWLRSQPAPDAIVLSNTLLAGLAAPLRDALGVPVICSVQGEVHYVHAMGERAPEVFEAMGRAMNHCDALVAVSQTAAALTAQALGWSHSRFHVVHNGIDTASFPEANPSEGPLRLGFLARIYPPKGPQVLVEAFSALRKRGHDATLVLAGTLQAGDFPEFEALKQQIAQLGLTEHVEFHTDLSPQAKRELLSGLSIFCVPTQKDETFGLYNLEALACGLPVVAPARGAVQEVLDGVPGVTLYTPGDLEALVNALEHHVVTRANAAEQAQAGREYVSSRHSELVMAKGLHNLLATLPGPLEAAS